MSEKDQASTQKKGETSGEVFSKEQQEHLKTMMAAVVMEAMTVHSKDQNNSANQNATELPGKSDTDKSSKQKVEGYKLPIRWEAWSRAIVSNGSL